MMGIGTRSAIATLVTIALLVIFYIIIFPRDLSNGGLFFLGFFFALWGSGIFLLMYGTISLLSRYDWFYFLGKNYQNVPLKRLLSIINIAIIGYFIMILILLFQNSSMRDTFLFGLTGAIFGSVAGAFRRLQADTIDGGTDA